MNSFPSASSRNWNHDSRAAIAPDPLCSERTGVDLHRDSNPPPLLVKNNTRAKPSSIKRKPSSAQRQKYRDKENLKHLQVGNLFEADRFAAHIGLPLQEFVTVAWLLTDHVRLTAGVWQKAIKRFMRSVRGLGHKTAYVYVHENPVNLYGDEVPNTHLLIHQSAGLPSDELSSLLAQAFCALDGGVQIQSRVEGKHTDWRMQYMAKGAYQQTCWAFGGRREPGGQGTIDFKRCGTSQNIGPTARQKYSHAADLKHGRTPDHASD